MGGGGGGGGGGGTRGGGGGGGGGGGNPGVKEAGSLRETGEDRAGIGVLKVAGTGTNRKKFRNIFQ